ncbi:sentrin-specific protease 7b isoform X2 [Engraulis encrasicolus]|uniref:sentrin-specific protease 7b isoform X2 n=1 Tax=Engraulis encrasicolus TaxID=184585 RepID=UPI002FCF871A
MSTPFRIPKLKQPSEKVYSHSPLGRINDADEPRKSTWTSSTSGQPSRFSRDSAGQNGHAGKPKDPMNGRADRWRPRRASDTLCPGSSRPRVVGNGLLGKRKATDSDSEEFTWSTTPLKQPRPKSLSREKEQSEHPTQGSNKSPVAENGSHHSKNGEIRGKPPTPEAPLNGTTLPSRQSPEAQVVPETPEKVLSERSQASQAGGNASTSSSSSSSSSSSTGDQAKKTESAPVKGFDPKVLSSSFNDLLAKRLDRCNRNRRVYTNTRKSKPKQKTPIEPIVLSSDDEKGDEDGGDTDPQNRTEQVASGKSSARPSEVPSVVELPFTELHMGTLKALSNGSLVITHEGLGIPLKGKGDDEVTVTVVASELQHYGVWDGGLAQDGTLFPSSTRVAPSLLFLEVSVPQARLMQTEMMEILSIPRPGQASPFLLLVLSEHLEDLQAGLLASVMDLIGLRSGQPGLATPLGWAEGLELLHYRGREEHLLALLGQGTDSTSLDDESAESPSGRTSSSSQSSSSQSRAKASSSSASKSWKTSSPGSSNQALPRRLIQYPPPPSKGGIVVTTEDLECLKSGEFLNDVIIDFYLKYLLQEKASHEMRERSHVFSSFFYKQLTRKDASEDASEGSVEYRRHQKVRTWTRHVDIFDKDYIFVPVNQEAHWYLVVICFPGLEKPQIVKWGGSVGKGSAGKKETCEAQASVQDPSEPSTSSNLRSQNFSFPDCTQKNCTKELVCKRPCILVMDSLKLSLHERAYKLLRDYLQVEWEVRRGTPRRFTIDTIKGSNCKVPLQDNSSDCGLYLLQYVEAFLQNPVVHFELPLRLERWFPRQHVRQKREQIRELVLDLYKEHGPIS